MSRAVFPHDRTLTSRAACLCAVRTRATGCCWSYGPVTGIKIIIIIIVVVVDGSVIFFAVFKNVALFKQYVFSYDFMTRDLRKIISFPKSAGTIARVQSSRGEQGKGGFKLFFIDRVIYYKRLPRRRADKNLVCGPSPHVSCNNVRGMRVV